MSKTTIAINIANNEYHRFAQIMPDEEDFQISYEEWVKIQAAKNASKTAQGFAIHQTTVNCEGFIAYCKATGQNPSYVVLEAFAVKEAYK